MYSDGSFEGRLVCSAADAILAVIEYMHSYVVRNQLSSLTSSMASCVQGRIRDVDLGAESSTSAESDTEDVSTLYTFEN